MRVVIPPGEKLATGGTGVLGSQWLLLGQGSEAHHPARLALGLLCCRSGSRLAGDRRSGSSLARGCQDRDREWGASTMAAEPSHRSPDELAQAAAGGLATAEMQLDDVQQAVVDTTTSVLLLGGAGTGKSATVQAASIGLTSRLGADRVLGITHDRSMARSWQARTAQELPGIAPRISTVVGLAGTILAETGQPQPRLLTAPEQEVRIRELLAGAAPADADLGADPEQPSWPAEWSTAVGTRAFARQLRRAVSHVRLRAWDPAELARVSAAQQDHGWLAVARFVDEYLQVLDWEGSVDYVEAVLRALRYVESGVWRGQPFAAVVIDDAQDLAPLELKLLRAVLVTDGQLIAAGDPDQSIWSFRGADPAVLADLARSSHCQVLSRCYRGPAELRDARAQLLGNRWYPGLPADLARPLRSPAIIDEVPGELALLEFDDPTSQSAHIAARLRAARAAGVPWRDMAVLSASATQDLPELIRSLGRAQIPVSVPGDDLPLVMQPAVAAVIAAARLSLDWGRDSLSSQEVEHVLSSELGGLGPADLRALRRWLRTRPTDEVLDADPVAPVTLAQVCTDAELRAELTERLPYLSHRIEALVDRLATAARFERQGRPPAEVLWALWDGPWPRRLRERALQSGAAGIAADRDLDAVMQLFRMAQRAPERWGGTRGLRAFLAEVESQQIAAEPDLQQQSYRDAVAVMSLRRSKGKQWQLVMVTGVQESVFGGGHPADGLFQLGRLTDSELLPLPAPAPLGEDRRLLGMALGRSSADVVLCAAGGVDDPPATLVAELGSGWQRVSGHPAEPQTPIELIARLRDVAADPAQRSAAARSLARLAHAGDGAAALVPAADVNRWPGVSDWTSAPAPIRRDDAPMRLSASAIEGLTDCPLRWFLGREAKGGRPLGTPAQFGLIVHEAVSELIKARQAGQDLDPEQLLAQLWTDDGYEAEWSAAMQRDEALAAIRRAELWLTDRWHLVESERALDKLFTLPDSESQVRLRGAIDLVERDEDGTARVWDFKTQGTAHSKADTASNQQLATYQLALALEQDDGQPVDGAGFVYLRLDAGKNNPQPATRQQESVDIDTQLAHTADLVRIVGEEEFPAHPGAQCARCDFRDSCPAQGGQ